jgi:hypothetical protein
MGIFGWDLPPGVSMRDIDPPEGPCDVCGKSVDDCICPECPVCHSHGDPACYEKHGLVRTQAQIDSRTALDEQIERDAEAENAMWDQIRQESLNERDGA